MAERLEHALSCSRLSAPSRSTRPGVPVTSTMVEAAPPGDGPRVDHHLDVLAQHLLGLGGLGRGRAAGRLAELTASGPVRSRISRATGWSGIRTATVPRVSPRSHCSDGCAWQTRVSAPGQNSSTRARA